MLYAHVPVIASDAGSNDDGVFLGAIKQSNLITYQVLSTMATTVYAIRKDHDTASQFVDISATAISDVDNSVLPWGSDADFSASDELWLSPEDTRDLCEIYVKITTPGVWAGAGLKVYESLDGESLVEVANLDDGTNGLRAAAGVYRIKFDINADRKKIAPYFGAVKRKYVVIRPNGFTGKTTAPKLSRIWLSCPSNQGVWEDQTADQTKALTDSTFSAGMVALSGIPQVGSVAISGFAGKAIGFDDYLYRGIPQVHTIVQEYLAADETWKLFQNITGVAVNDMHTLGPSTYSTTPVKISLRWDMPADWVAQALTFNTGVTYTAFYHRIRVLTVSSHTPFAIPLFRRKSRSFGVGLAAGIHHKLAESYSHLMYRAGVTPTTDTVIALTNNVTGDTRMLTMPQNISESWGLSSGRINFDVLNIGVDQHLLAAYKSGGTATDVEFWIG